MTDGLLLDTHIVLWLANGDVRLRAATRGLIEQRWRAGEAMLVSAVSAWEIGLLADAGRIDLGRPAAEWVGDFLQWPGVVGVPLSPTAAVSAYALEGLVHRDPADRLLVATAVELGCAFVTYDARLIAFGAAHGGACGLTLAG